MTSTPSENPAPVAGKAKTGAKPRWLPIAYAAIVVLAAAVLIYAAYVSSRETTDDAFLDGTIVAVAPSVPGHVIAVHVQDNQLVKKDDPLVDIDPSTYTADLAQKKAAVSDADSNATEARAALAGAKARLRVLEAAVDQAKADAAADQAKANRTQVDLKRDANLLQSGALTQQDYDLARENAAVDAADSAAAAEKIAGAEAQLEQARTDIPAAEAAVSASEAAVAQAAASRQDAEIDLSDTRIAAPSDGWVTRKDVDPGDYVQAGQSLLALVAPGLWVTANYKESQLADMRPGQPVEIDIDAAPGRTYRGRVDSIQAGSGARFSLFPPENATGNYVKVVERVPVKIVLGESPDPGATLGPGESVTPTVITGHAHVPLTTLVLTVIVTIVALFGARRIALR